MPDTNDDQDLRQRPFKSLIKDDAVKSQFQEIMGKNSGAFLVSVLNVVRQSDRLAKADPQSILMAAAVAGTLNLPIDPNLGQAFIIPYNMKIPNTSPPQYKVVAQFQIGWKGLVQLGHRSGQYSRINVSDVREGEIQHIDRLTGDIEWNWNQNQDQRSRLPLVGYVAFIALNGGFQKSLFMTVKELQAHGATYSKTYKQTGSRWKTDFDSMATKTVLKLLMDKYGPKTVEMQKAIKTDQALVLDMNGENVQYIDNEPKSKEEIEAEKLAEIMELLEDPGLTIAVEERMAIEMIVDKKEVLSYDKAIKTLKENKPKK